MNIQHRNHQLRKLLPFAFSLFTLFIFVSCEPFEPMQENDRYFFSMYGFLDASADTQWVRVTQPRQQLESPPEIPEMKVTLEHLENENTITMNDTLIRFQGDFNVTNVWTDQKIEPGQTYRLLAERPDGMKSRVTVTMPEDFRTPLVRRGTGFGRPETYEVFIQDVEVLADVQTRWYVRLHGSGIDEKRMYSFSYRNSALPTSIYQSNYSVEIVPRDEMDQIRRSLLTSEIKVDILHRQIFVASGGPEWDEDIASIDDLIYNLPVGFSNVENGVGYMAGIVSKWVPYRMCLQDDVLLIACPEEKPFW